MASTHTDKSTPVKEAPCTPILYVCTRHIQVSEKLLTV